MANLNKVFLMGRLTRDPEIRHTPQGTAVAKLGMAVNRFYRTQSGEQREETCFVDIEAWDNQAQTIQRYLRKGSPLFVEGQLKLDTWETQQGEKRSKLYVRLERFQFIDSPQSRGFDSGQGGQGQQSGQGQQGQQDGQGQQGDQGRQQGGGPRQAAPQAPAQQANEKWGTYPNHPVDDDLNLPAAGGPDNDVPF